MVREFVQRLERRYAVREMIQRRLSNRKFIRNSGLLMLANLIVVVLGLIRTPAMTWMLPKDEVGMMGVVGAWLPFIQLLSFSGLDAASYHYVAKGYPSAFAVNLAYRLRWSSLSTLAFLVGAAIWAWRGEPGVAWMFLISGISYPITYALSATSGMLAAQERFTGLFWYRIFESLTDFTGFIPLLFSVFWVNKIVTFYAGNQLATAIMLGGLSVLFLRELKRAGSSMPEQDERELLRYGKHLTVMGGIGVVQVRTEAMLISAFLPLGVMADYSIATLVYEQMNRLWNIYLTVRYPPLVRMELNRRRRRVLVEGILACLLFIGVAAAVIVAAHVLIPLVLPPSYRSSLRYIDWLIAAFVASVPGQLADMYFRTEQDERHLYVMRIASAVTGVIAPVIFIWLLGRNGVAFGRVASGLMLSVVGFWLFWRAYSRARNGSAV